MKIEISDILNKRNSLNLLTFAAFLLGIRVTGILVSDMYVPALPAITKALHTHPSSIQLSITIYVLSLAFSQSIYGPLSDRFGRRIIIISGLLISLIGTVVCIFAGSITGLLVGRFIQGVGVGSPLCMYRSLTRDVFDTEQMAKFGSYLSLVYALAPAFAPILGGYSFHYFGWRSIFTFIAAYTVMLSFLIWKFFPETGRLEHRTPISTKSVLKNYYQLLCDKEYVAFSLSTGIAMSCIIVYYSMSPFLLQNVLHLSTMSYAWLSIYITIAVLAGRVVNVVLCNYLNVNQMVFFGCLGMFISSLLMLVLGEMGYLSVEVIVIPMMLNILSSGLVYSNAIAGALRNFSDMAGSAGALFGTIQKFSILIASVFAATLHETTQVPMAGLMTVITLLGVVFVYFGMWGQAPDKLPTGVRALR